jgi:hypothetical protein
VLVAVAVGVRLVGGEWHQNGRTTIDLSCALEGRFDHIWWLPGGQRPRSASSGCTGTLTSP